MKSAVIIVAAGRGTRAIGDIADIADIGDIGHIGDKANQTRLAKQYQLLDHRTMLAHTLDKFIDNKAIDAIQVVIHKNDQKAYQAVLDEISNHAKFLPPAFGGATRQASVYNGLKALQAEGADDETITFIHDAARPFVSNALIDELISHTQKNQGVIPALAVVDTIKRGQDDHIKETVLRDNLYGAQTPQSFLFGDIFLAHESAHKNGLEGLTDDADIAQQAGISVKLIKGERKNIKITILEDLRMARQKMEQNFPDVRTGQGYDSHVFDENSDLILCGVKLEHSHGLKGHSDADVGLHALTDALLGTIASGDIGSHFPPSDEQWKGANSQQFLTHAAGLIAEQGGTINHVDVTLICEMPKIGPYRDKMRHKMAELLKMDLARVSLKATTNEQMGFIGRGEGMAAMATATVIFGVSS